MSTKSKVLSVRLSLESLQSCFDLCEALGVPTTGASAAIARSIETLTRDLRERGTLPSYTKHELDTLIPSFIARKNPTSMPSLERLSSTERQTAYRNEDFAPVQPISRDLAIQQAAAADQEYKDIIEEKIQEQIANDEIDLLKKILIGGN